MTFKKRAVLTALMLGMMPTLAGAATTVNFRGNLIIPDCIVNNNQPMEVDFGDIEIQTLDAANTAYHAQDFNIPMNCPYTAGAPKLMLMSTDAHNASQGVIRTSKYSEGLVIYLRQKGGSPVVPLGVMTDVTNSVTGSSTSRTLTLNAAVGRYRDMQYLTPGQFTAAASLQVRYE